MNRNNVTSVTHNNDTDSLNQNNERLLNTGHKYIGIKKSKRYIKTSKRKNLNTMIFSKLHSRTSRTDLSTYE